MVICFLKINFYRHAPFSSFFAPHLVNCFLGSDDITNNVIPRDKASLIGLNQFPNHSFETVGKHFSLTGGHPSRGLSMLILDGFVQIHISISMSLGLIKSLVFTLSSIYGSIAAMRKLERELFVFNESLKCCK